MPLSGIAYVAVAPHLGQERDPVVLCTGPPGQSRAEVYRLAVTIVRGWHHGTLPHRQAEAACAADASGIRVLTLPELLRSPHYLPAWRAYCRK